jgi:hypothetical protein
VIRPESWTRKSDALRHPVLDTGSRKIIDSGSDSTALTAGKSGMTGGNGSLRNLEVFFYKIDPSFDSLDII